MVPQARRPLNIPLLVEIVTDPVVSVWDADSNGIWSSAENWRGGTPNTASARALFGGAIMQPREITVVDPVKAGRIEFNNSSTYTVGGTNTLTLETTSGDAVINVIKGSHSITAPLVLLDDTVIAVKSGVSNLSITALMPSDSLVTKVGAGKLTVNNVRAAQLSINSGTVTVTPDGTSPGTSVVEALSMRERTTLDLTDNAVVIDYTGPSPVAAIRQQIRNGRGGPGLGKTWNGEGITSSAAAAAQPESRSVAYAENALLPLGPYRSFRGQQVDDTSVIVTYTRTGDANLDGVVNDDDVTIVGATYLPGVPRPHWALGDFDYDGFIDEDDVTLLGVFYDPSAVPESEALMVGTATPVPEPASLLMVVLACLSAAPFVFGKSGQVQKDAVRRMSAPPWPYGAQRSCQTKTAPQEASGFVGS